MSVYADQLRALHSAALGKDTRAILPMIRRARADVFPPEQRIAIYTDAYRIRMEEAVLSDFPALVYLIGKDAARAAIRAFVDVTPSASWNLNPYSYTFPTFFAAHSDHAGACDVATLEGTIVEIFRMPESDPVTADMFASLGESGLETAIFKMRAASRLLHLNTSAHAFVRAFRAGDKPEAPESVSEYLCIVRHHNEVRRICLAPDEYMLLSYIREGMPFADAAAKAAAGHEESFAAALPGYIGQWLEHGLLTFLD